MQYHYVVMYDSDKKQWSVLVDREAYFPDGNVWSDALSDETGYGWFFPEDDTPVAAIEMDAFNILWNVIPACLPSVEA